MALGDEAPFSGLTRGPAGYYALINTLPVQRLTTTVIATTLGGGPIRATAPGGRRQDIFHRSGAPCRNFFRPL
jgi:hypothetical protein